MLTIRVHRKPAYVLITAFGAIDITTVGRLRDRLFGLAGDGRPLVVDLDQVSLPDAAGLGVLAGAAHRAAAHGTRLYVVCTQQETLRRFESAGLDRQIRLMGTLDEAVHDLMAAPDAHLSTRAP
jgi:anti-sigma B factor antagonist